MAWSSKFIVHTKYCDGHETHHEGDDRNEAIDEYVAGLRLAFDPPEQKAIALSANTSQVGVAPKHIRQVTMLVYDTDDNLIHHIDSGVFPCEDVVPQPV